MAPDRLKLYDIIYALAASEGREAELFGESAPFARVAFAQSLAGDYFPELWFELPLAGAPWFDLHVLASHGDLDGVEIFSPERCGEVPGAFEWFASQKSGVRQLALSWDTGSGSSVQPAVQLLMGLGDVRMTCEFLEACGRADAAGSYRVFRGRLPEEWFACYAGVFPARAEPFLRVECIPQPGMQKRYAEEPGLLGSHFLQVGLDKPGDTLVSRCTELARTPFALEFQFDVTPAGVAGDTFSASLRFCAPTGGDMSGSFLSKEASALMERICQWELADERWHRLGETAFAKRASFAGEETVVFSYPAFVKLRWRAGEPIDAKAYLIAGAQRGKSPC